MKESAARRWIPGTALSALLVLTAFFGPASLFADPGGEKVIRNAENLMRGTRNSHWSIRMDVKRPRWDRSLEIESWEDRRGNSSFIRILSPPGDRGTAFLKKSGSFYQYIPRIRRTIRISRSMMLTSWMGSDFNNDDLARESSWAKDYDHSAAKETPCGESKGCLAVTMTAKENTPVVWPRIEAVVRKDFVPVEFTYYNLRGEAIKKMTFSDVKSVQGRPFPHYWNMINLKQEGHRTEVHFLSVEFDRGVSSGIFTKRNLTRGR